MLCTGLFAFRAVETRHSGCAGRDGNEGLVVLHLAQHPVGEELGIVLLCRHLGPAAVGAVEGQPPVPSFFVLHGRCEPVSLFGVDVYDGGACGAFHAVENFDELFQVVALFEVDVLESPSLEPVVLARAVAFAQCAQVLVDAAMVFGDGHFVVVDHDEDAGAEFGCLVESFEGFAAGEGAVADDGDDVLVGAFEVTGFLQTGGQTDGGGGVANLKIVVFGTLCGRGIAGNGVHVFEGAEKTEGATGEHLVGVGLVADIEHEFVLRRVENVVEGHGGFHETEVRSDVAAVLAHTVQDGISGFGGHHLKGFEIQRFQVGR